MKRSEIIKYLNEKLDEKFPNSFLCFEKSFVTSSIEINIKNHPLIEDDSMMNLKPVFYDYIKKCIKQLGFEEEISWNNSGHIFSIWINSSTLFYEMD